MQTINKNVKRTDVKKGRSPLEATDKSLLLGSAANAVGLRWKG